MSINMQAKRTIKELKTMPLKDLQRELKEQAVKIKKMKIGIDLKKEKNTGAYKMERKKLARIKTVIAEREKNPSSEQKHSPASK